MPDTSLIKNEKLVVSIQPLEDGVVLESSCGSIHLSTSHPHLANTHHADFAAWYFLPLAMRLNKTLHIQGRGTCTTVENAQKLSDVWHSWLPSHFYSIDLTFDEQTTLDGLEIRHKPELCFYSGGLDAAYTLLKRIQDKKPQDLLTVHGMDYSLADEVGFVKLLEKTQAFTRQAGGAHIIVRSNAYGLYKKYDINYDTHHIAHAFSLAGAGFWHGLAYPGLVLAADDPLEVQFMTHPWGTNSATNRLFDSGITRLVTDSEAISRSEKIEFLMSSESAITSLAFCWNRNIQPDNCGECFKCLQTKLMFLASTGVIPPIFLSQTINPNWLRKLKYKTPTGLSRVMEILVIARRKGHTALIPAFEEAEQTVFAYYKKEAQEEPSLLSTAKRPTTKLSAVKLSTVKQWFRRG